MNPNPRFAIVGPTASGKSAVGLELARRQRRWEIVSVDSMQVYRGMDIGTAKPTAAERAEVRHHVLDLVDPWQEHGLRAYQAAARSAVADIEGRGRWPLLVGGTGLYLRAVVDDLEIPGQYPQARAEVEEEVDTAALHRRLVELDPVAASRMEPSNRRRIVRALEVVLGSGRRFSDHGPGLDHYGETPFRLFGVDLPDSEIDWRIATRYERQMRSGLLDEVERLSVLSRAGRPLSATAAQALGYRELLPVVRGERCPGDALAEAVRRTRQFARRQRRWFRRDPRIQWCGSGSALLDVLDAAAGHPR